MASQVGQLTRSTTDRMLGGVAGGMAAYFGMDTGLMRVLWVAAAFTGVGILVYIALWVVLPKGAPVTPAARVAEERFARGEIDGEELRRIRQELMGQSVAPTSTLRIAEERFARGEIDAEELQRIRAELART
jgi:phage shock protein C